MPRVQSELQKARRHDCLWPTIADAVDTYVRRRASDAHGYERVWRLIHILESVEITLAAVGMSRLVDGPTEGSTFREDIRKCREFCYGQSWDSEERAFNRQQGAFDGSIDRWIDILWTLARLESPPGQFLPKLKAFLNAEAINLAPFLEAWRSACDVPVKAENKPLSVKECIRQVNTFRNRYAHVPFPPPPIDEIATALEDVMEQLFRARGEENGPEPWNTTGVLTGAVTHGTRYLRGCGLSTLSPPEGLAVAELSFVFTHDQKGREHEHWTALPFAHLDASMNGYILTRLKNVDLGTWEYTRFKAEKSPVLTVDNAEWLQRFAPPHPTEYPQPEVPHTRAASAAPPEEPPTDEAVPAKPQSYSDAIDAMRHGEFGQAAEFFESLVEERPRYHVGWLKLGIARREEAVRLPETERQKATALLEKSVEALTTATGHADPEYSASAYYERSKAYFRLNRLTSDANLLSAARNDAVVAAKMSPDDRYLTWVDYLERLPGPIGGEREDPTSQTHAG